MLTIKVLSYNIHKGFSLFPQNFVLDMIREGLRKASPDLVFLQEVLGEHNGSRKRIQNWPSVAQFEFLADSVWPHFAYGKNAVYTEGHHGNAILSKFPIVQWSNFDISNNRLERRGLLHVELDIPSQPEPVHAICLHLDLLERGRLTQMRKVSDWIAAHVPKDRSLILAGDFNDWQKRSGKLLATSLQLQEVFEMLHGDHAKTFPSFWPRLSLDRIYYRRLHPEDAQTLAGDPWNRLSDHIPLLAEFKTDPKKLETL